MKIQEYYFECEKDLLTEGYDFYSCWVYFETEEETEKAVKYFEPKFPVQTHFDAELDPCIEIYLGNVKRTDEEEIQKHKKQRELCEKYLRAIL